MRLELTDADLEGPSIPGGEKGLRVWWTQRPKRKKPLLVVAWPDLTLFDVAPVWPAGCHPERHGGWGDQSQSFHVVRLAELGRVFVRAGVPVLNFAEVLATSLGNCTKLARTRHTTKVDSKFRFLHFVRPDRSAVYVSKLAVTRLESTFGVDLDYRETKPSWAASTLVVAYRKRTLVGIAGALEESTYFEAAKAAS